MGRLPLLVWATLKVYRRTWWLEGPHAGRQEPLTLGGGGEGQCALVGGT